ncbi:M23 family metallopeptidase [Agrobacterium vitis]|uniref:M23 family metallopeptidase n=1 Tax=Agrobacterium vitis TaxID=373 RepID=UPI0012E73EC8|nr:M23 family metallopeptidase [Agrobacterium vitis]MVA35979.1 peptidoglycan DD-metalloendopeptidase family protein [Agrobacterium vitis]
MMKTRSRKGFSKRQRQQHVLILASGETIRHMTLRPWMAGLGLCLVVAGAVGYLGATSYLIMRDNLIGASMARQAHLQHDYEDRISALRAQVDRVTSRQLLDQQVVEEKLQTLLEKQMALSARSGKLGSLLDRAEESGLTPNEPSTPAAQDKSASAAPVRAPLGKSNALAALNRMLQTGPGDTQESDGAALGFAPSHESGADRADRVFRNVTLSLKSIEQQQKSSIHALTAEASDKASTIEQVLTDNGIQIDKPDAGKDGMGGPLVDADPKLGIDTSLDGLDSALNRLDSARETAKDMPFSNPAATHEITSPFGNRPDPLLGRLAMHTGIDFRATNGSPVKSAGAGTVITAGPTGGYGNMVEIDHGQGLSTRYGHMSKILVRPGEKIEVGQLIGLSGSTGRSTGPHLHYEIRKNGNPINPMSFLASGMTLKPFIQ